MWLHQLTRGERVKKMTCNLNLSCIYLPITLSPIILQVLDFFPIIAWSQCFELWQHVVALDIYGHTHEWRLAFKKEDEITCRVIPCTNNQSINKIPPPVYPLPYTDPTHTQSQLTFSFVTNGFVGQCHYQCQGTTMSFIMGLGVKVKSPTLYIFITFIFNKQGKYFVVFSTLVTQTIPVI